MPSKAFRNLGAGSTVRAMDTWGHENGCTMLGPGVAHQRQACFIAAPKPILDGWTTAALVRGPFTSCPCTSSPSGGHPRARAFTLPRL